MMWKRRGSQVTTKGRKLPHDEVWGGIFSYRMDGHRKQKPHHRPENTDAPHLKLMTAAAAGGEGWELENLLSSTPHSHEYKCVIDQIRRGS
jgi:hypothetical protein